MKNEIEEAIESGWTVTEDREIRKEFAFPDFAKAMAFANKIATIAEEENHHPDLFVSWGKVVVSLTTHDTGAPGALTEKDFSLAKRIDMI